MSKETRMTKRRPKKKKSTGRIVFGIAFLLLNVMMLVVGVFVWQAYRDLRATTDDMYEPVEQEAHTSRTENPVDVDAGETPFSVLIMGVDTDSDDSMVGRSDTLMLMTVNPNTETSTILSIPRDTYTEIVGRGTNDKINHAYAFGGTSMTVNSVQNLLDVPVDYYVSVNMASMVQIIDAVGGITITPPLTFTQGNYSFVEGQPTQMDGTKALSYSRMRKNDPEGDYGRQHRQRQVIEGTMQSIASLNSVSNYRSILASMSESMRTNMSFDDMVDMLNNYRSSANNVEQMQLRGSSMFINNIYYEQIPQEELNRVTTELKTQLELN
ncbi:Cell envelope-associated transcriptional attenuator [Alkalibacterium sp. AK22]|uniref:LCP family glycopolymer transferase n=1 Tax=Alkalibacterium sp. AK22 TaxID=1229520 RepID=UPI000448B39D|nr:LCP family protein [Alkalibacterium sp. AK22]EXJ23305.1 Cell envelope-associated transcriptional attenuator [Alkalibacterium sp. AK22]